MVASLSVSGLTRCRRRPELTRSRRTAALGLRAHASPCSSAVLLSLAVAGCLVDERCYTDADCDAPSVCNADGRCQVDCLEDSDCDATHGTAYVCNDHRCVMPVACTLCVFEHAQSSCVHGECTRGDCDEGYVDLNGDSQDGCEYSCTLSGAADVCNGVDDDCDGHVDEDTDLQSDPSNCGACGHHCPSAPHADPTCASGECRLSCHDGWHDNNGLDSDGCEAEQCVPSEEVCDGHDNDCDCPGDSDGDGDVCGPGDEGVDEGFDKTRPSSCGPFCVACVFDHATALCVDGECRLGVCDSGWYDFDRREQNGCETQCSPTNGGVEICDGLDNDCNGRVDEVSACSQVCSDDMVPVGAAFCIDRYEASRSDATADSAGNDETVAASRAGVIPWMVSPMTDAAYEVFRTACAAAGKRLCRVDEWTAACTGPDENPYVYGTLFDREACNCVDTFCDDWCTQNGISLEDCSLGENCGYDLGWIFHEVPTGTFPRCTNAYGTFDINGNAWEIVESPTAASGYEIRGGAFNCSGAETRVSCSGYATWADLYAGFRCCRDLP
jgi:hypothetical protein